MKLSERLIILTFENPKCLSFMESAASDRIGKSIADLKDRQTKVSKSNIGSILGNILNDLQLFKANLKGEQSKIVKKDIDNLFKIIQILGFKPPENAKHII